MDSEEIKIAKQLLQKGWSQIKDRQRDKIQLQKLYFAVHKNWACCDEIIETFYNKELPSIIYKPLNSKIIMAEKTNKQNYHLKEGRSAYVPEFKKHIVSGVPHGDAEAEALLKKNPNAITLFLVYPDDWQERIGIASAPKKKTAPKKGAKEAPAEKSTLPKVTDVIELIKNAGTKAAVKAIIATDDRPAVRKAADAALKSLKK